MALRRILFVLCALLLGFSTVASAQTFPKLTGQVVDDAHLLSPEQMQSITQKLAMLEQQTGRQLVVATVPDLQGYDIADYGYQLGRSWGIGEKDKNTGALLIVAPNERRVRIEAGYGLEGVLTDAVSSIIINNSIVPRFKAGDMPGGIEAGTDELIRVLQLPPEEQRQLAKDAGKPRKASGGDIFKAIIIVGFILFFIFISAARATRRGGQRYRGGISPIVLWGADMALRSAFHDRDDDGGGWGGGGGGGWGGGGGGFSGGGGSFGGGGASGGW